MCPSPQLACNVQQKTSTFRANRPVKKAPLGWARCRHWSADTMREAGFSSRLEYRSRSVDYLGMLLGQPFPFSPISIIDRRRLACSWRSSKKMVCLDRLLLLHHPFFPLKASRRRRVAVDKSSGVRFLRRLNYVIRSRVAQCPK